MINELFLWRNLKKIIICTNWSAILLCSSIVSIKSSKHLENPLFFYLFSYKCTLQILFFPLYLKIKLIISFFCILNTQSIFLLKLFLLFNLFWVPFSWCYSSEKQLSIKSILFFLYIRFKITVTYNEFLIHNKMFNHILFIVKINLLPVNFYICIFLFYLNRRSKFYLKP